MDQDTIRVRRGQVHVATLTANVWLLVVMGLVAVTGFGFAWLNTLHPLLAVAVIVGASWVVVHALCWLADAVCFTTSLACDHVTKRVAR